MTTGSPVAAAVSGPGVALTKAIRLLSGDQAKAAPREGSGVLVPSTLAIDRAPSPFAFAIIRKPLLMNARLRPSGDQTGDDDWSPSVATRLVLPSATLITQ